MNRIDMCQIYVFEGININIDLMIVLGFENQDDARDMSIPLRRFWSIKSEKHNFIIS
jgi:hypothetical protein